MGMHNVVAGLGRPGQAGWTLSEQIAHALEPVRWRRAEPFLDDLDVEGAYRKAHESQRGGSAVDLGRYARALDRSAAEAVVCRVWPHLSRGERWELLEHDMFRLRMITEAIDRRAAEDGRVRIGGGPGQGLTLSAPAGLRRWHIDRALADQLEVEMRYQELRTRGSTRIHGPATDSYTGMCDQRSSLLSARAIADGVRVKMAQRYESHGSDVLARQRAILREREMQAVLADGADHVQDQDGYVAAAAAKIYYDLRRGCTTTIHLNRRQPSDHDRLVLARLEHIAGADGYGVDTDYDRGWPWMYVSLVRPAPPETTSESGRSPLARPAGRVSPR